VRKIWNPGFFRAITTTRARVCVCSSPVYLLASKLNAHAELPAICGADFGFVEIGFKIVHIFWLVNFVESEAIYYTILPHKSKKY
jgi:hypothetical protein